MTHPAAPPATFNDFIGNTHAVESLRTAIAAGRLPHSIILAGPNGAGKYTLALMLAMAVECERQPRELLSYTQPLASNGISLSGFCGICRNRPPSAEAFNLDELVSQAAAAPEPLR